MYELHAIIFALIITLLSMKIKLKSKILNFLGNHIFSIYMLQRIPMVIGQEMGLASRNHLVYFAFSLILTLVIAYVFDLIVGKLDGLLFHNRKRKLLAKNENV